MKDAHWQLIEEHLNSPYHAQGFLDANNRHAARNPGCGDEVELQLLIEEGTVVEAWHQPKGCFINQAAASMLCEFIEGKAVSELRNFQARNMLALIGITLTPRRQQCALLVFRALKTIVYSLEPEDESYSVNKKQNH